MTIVRGQKVMAFPTRFMLVAASNPCPCGMGDEDCRCTAADLARHHRRLSGPLLDRIDVLIGVGRPAAEALRDEQAPSSAAVSERVVAARERQADRLAAHGLACNAQMSARLLREHAAATPSAHAAPLRAPRPPPPQRPRPRPRPPRRAHGRRPRGQRQRRPRARRPRRRPPPRVGRAGRGARDRRPATRACGARALIAALCRADLDVEWRKREVDRPRAGAARRGAARARHRGRRRARLRGLRRAGARARARPRRAPASSSCAAATRGTRSGCASWPTRPRCCTSPGGCRLTRRTRWRSSAPAAATAYGLEVARALGRGLSARGRAGGLRARARRRLRRRTRARWRRTAPWSPCWPAAPTSPTRRASASSTRRSSDARRRGVRDAAGLRADALVLRRAQPDHRRPRARHGRRRGRAALRLADHRGLRRRAGPDRRRGARRGSPARRPRARTG